MPNCSGACAHSHAAKQCTETVDLKEGFQQEVEHGCDCELPRHFESESFVNADSGALFAQLDDQRRLSSHMSKSCWKVGGVKMLIEFDQKASEAVGSHMRLSGRVFGIRLVVEEVVTERMPPFTKTWRTVGSPRLLFIGQDQMKFQISPHPRGSRLRVFIDYGLPESRFGRWLGRWFAGFYARWCTQQMVQDAARHFALG